MWRGTTLAILASGWAAPALAQAADPSQTSPWKIDARASLVGAAIDEETPLAPAADGFLADLGLVVTRSDTFDNGLSLIWRGEVRVQRDAASRPSFAGVVGFCQPSNPACPRIASGSGFLSPVSPATGIAAGGPLQDEDIFASIEGASVTFSGAWGDGEIGLDSGAATRLDARAPTVLERVSAFSSSLDPTGLVTARARNDVTGSSAKATYLSPRWLGLKVGVSWTPEANHQGVDFDPRFRGPGLASAELENVWEGGVSFARQFAEQGLRVRAAVTATRADSGSAFAQFGDYKAWGAGLELEKGNWTGGLRWLSSDNAWSGPGGGDYEAWEFGLVRQGDKWRIGLEAGWSDDDLTRTEGASWLIGASRKINDHVRLGLAWMDAGADLPRVSGLAFGHQNARNDGLVVELSVGNW